MLNYLPLALLLAATTTSPAFAQAAPGTTTSQPKQFCRLYVSLRSSADRALSIEMAYGQESKKAPLADSRLAEEATKVASFDSESQAFTYLSSRGWELVGYQYLTGAYVVAQFQRSLSH
jgi:hypothetical protein